MHFASHPAVQGGGQTPSALQYVMHVSWQGCTVSVGEQLAVLFVIEAEKHTLPGVHPAGVGRTIEVGVILRLAAAVTICAAVVGTDFAAGRNALLAAREATTTKNIAAPMSIRYSIEVWPPLRINK